MSSSGTTFGPVYPLPLGVTYQAIAPGNSNIDPIQPGGMDFSYTIANFATYTGIGWGQGQPAASMNDPILNPNGPLIYDAALSSGMTAVWSGTTSISGDGLGSYSGVVYTELVATIVSGASGWVTDTWSSQPTDPQEIALIDSSNFVVNLQWLASTTGNPGTFIAMQGFFDSDHANTGFLQTSTDGEFAGQLPALDVATFLANQTSIDASGATVDIADLGSSVAGALDTLNSDPQVGAIALTDSGTPTLTLTLAQALNDTAALAKITTPFTIHVVDLAATLHTITGPQANALIAENVTEISASDTNVAFAFAASAALYAAGVEITAPANDFARETLSSGVSYVYDFNAADVLFKLVTTNADGTFDDLFYNTPGVFQGVNYAQYDNQFSKAGARTQENFEDVSGAILAHETFGANGAFAIYVGGDEIKQRNADAGGAYDIHFFNAPGSVAGFAYAGYDSSFSAAGAFTGATYFDGSGNVIGAKVINADKTSELSLSRITGQTYTSYQNGFSAASVEVGHTQDNSDGVSGNFNLFGSQLVVNEGAGQYGPSGAATDFSFTNHPTEIYNYFNGAANDVIAFSPGFGTDTVKNFTTAGAAGDVLNISGLFTSFTAAQGAMAMSGNNTVITDASNDTITIIGVQKGSLTAGELGFP